MRAAVIVSPGRAEIEEVEKPQPDKGQIRVRLQGCGVCASNIPPWDGREWFSYPMDPGSLGHEGWGVVDEVGADVRSFAPGDRVAFLSNHAYAEFDLAEEASAIRIPKSLEGRPFPGEPLGCAMNIFQRSGIRSGDTVAIVGVGFLGTLLTQLAAGAGARVVAVARKPYALDIATRMGAEELLLSNDRSNAVERVKELTGGTLCDVVVECTGKQEPLDLSAELTKERGRLVIAGFHQDGPRQINMFLWNWRGLDVINAHEREEAVYIHGIQRAIDAVAEGRMDPEPLYTNTFPLDRLGEALEMTRTRPEGFMKALINMEA